MVVRPATLPDNIQVLQHNGPSAGPYVKSIRLTLSRGNDFNPGITPRKRELKNFYLLFMKKEQKVKYVYVISKSGKPLMPTTRLGRVRHFLEDGEVKIVNYEPFTIQLLRDSTEYVQELNLGCDPGYENTAISVTSKDKEVYSEQYIHTTDMSANLTRRAEYKRNRRSRKTRRRKARFNNRKNRAGKLAPSMEHLRDTIKREIESVCRILPVSKIYIENVKYDAQKALNPDIQG